MKFRQEEQQEWAPVGTSPIPETKTQSQMQKIPPSLETAVALEDSLSILDLCIQRGYLGDASQLIVSVYIRPLQEEIDKLIEGKEKISYIFRGINVNDLKQKFESAFKKLKYLSSNAIGREVFQYQYHIKFKKEVYSSAESLNKSWYKN